MTLPLRKKLTERLHVKVESRSYQWGKILITFCFVDFAWIFFRANSLRNSLEIIWRMFKRPDWWNLFNENIYTWGLDRKEFHIMILGLLVLLLVDLVKKLWGKRIDAFLSEECLWFRWTILLLLLFSCIVFGIYGQGYDASQFIYFQF